MAVGRPAGAVATALGVLALCLAACGSPAHKVASTTTSDTTGDTGETPSTLAYDPTPPPAPITTSTTTTTTSPPPTATTALPGTTLSISGTSPATQVTINENGQETQHTGVPLPWAETLSGVPSIVVLLAQTGSGDPSATVTCSIAPPGRPTVTNTSTGAYATVTCEDNGT